MAEPAGIARENDGSAVRARGAPATAAGRGGRTLVVMNPAAGHTRTGQLRQRLAAAFARRGAELDIVVTEGPGHATALARAATAGGYRAVCAVGGDGTVAETAAALAGTGTPLAVVPRGTANQVAANLRIPRNIEAAVQVALEGRIVDLDMGRVEQRFFALAAGAGLDAAVIARATPALKERWGFGAYVYATLKEAVTAPRARFTIVADGRDLQVEALSVLIANVGALYATLPYVRMPMTPSPDRAWHDGLLDVVILSPRNVPHFAGLVARLAVRGFGGDGLLHLRAREVRIEGDPVVPLQIDGDSAGQTPFTAIAMPRALRVLTPRRRS